MNLQTEASNRVLPEKESHPKPKTTLVKRQKCFYNFGHKTFKTVVSKLPKTFSTRTVYHFLNTNGNEVSQLTKTVEYD